MAAISELKVQRFRGDVTVATSLFKKDVCKLE